MQEPWGPQCYRCGKRGHLKRDCNEPLTEGPPPNRPSELAQRPLPPQEQVFQAHQTPNSQRGGRGGRNRRGGRGNPENQRRQGQVRGAANQVTLNDEFEEKAEIYAALDPSGRNQQYSVIETQVEYQGNSFSLLVDSGSTHSFISPTMVSKLGVRAIPTGKRLRASLANGSEVLIDEKIVNLRFTLQGHFSQQDFRVMKMGKFQGILGMDWLRANNADIQCGKGTISFQTEEGKIVLIQGKNGKSPLGVVKASRLVKGLKKGLDIFVLKLNNPTKILEGKEPEWLSEYQDVFPEELTELPPSRGQNMR